MQQLDLPMFLTIDKGITNDLISWLDSQFNSAVPRKMLIFTSKGLYERFREGIDNLVKQNAEISVFFVEDSSYDIAVNAAKRISIEDIEIIIGFGGGKVLDTAKYASYVSKKKYVSVPTILSNDGLASPIAVLKTGEGKAKSLGCKSPDGIIIDIDMIRNAPRTLLTAGIGDTVSNYTSLFDWKLAGKHRRTHVNDFAYLLSDTALNMLLFSRETDIGNDNFIRQLAQSLILSGLAMDIAGNSGPCSGSEHLFSHSLDEYYVVGVPHGLKVALGTVVSCMFQNRDYEPITEFLSRYNIDVSPRTLGISKETFVGAWMKAQSTRPDRFTVLDTIEVTEDYLESIYDKLLEVL